MTKEQKKEIVKQIKNLEIDLKYTLLTIDGKNENLDLIFNQQTEKIKKEIKSLKKTIT